MIPWTAVLQASLPFTITLSLLKLMSIESMMPSTHLILCCPLSSYYTYVIWCVEPEFHCVVYVCVLSIISAPRRPELPELFLAVEFTYSLCLQIVPSPFIQPASVIRKLQKWRLNGTLLSLWSSFLYSCQKESSFKIFLNEWHLLKDNCIRSITTT